LIPESPCSFFGKEASDFTRRLAQGKTLRLEFDFQRTDKYQRTLAYVFLSDGTFLNAEIVKQGYGHAYVQYPFKYLDQFPGYEREAREAGRGLWGGATDAAVVVPTRKPVRADSLWFSWPSNSLRSVMPIAGSVLLSIRSLIRSRAALHVEVLALRHQLLVLERSRRPRVRLTGADRLLWVWFSRVWTGWRTTLVLVQPETVVDWHRRGFRWFWTSKSRPRRGRPTVPADVRALIRTMSQANPLWGAPRIHGELRKLGIAVSQSSVAKYMVRRQTPPSQTWRTFLATHVDQIMAAEFFVVPT
jgi:hypothetical protein